MGPCASHLGLSAVTVAIPRNILDLREGTAMEVVMGHSLPICGKEVWQSGSNDSAGTF